MHQAAKLWQRERQQVRRALRFGLRFLRLWGLFQHNVHVRATTPKEFTAALRWRLRFDRMDVEHPGPKFSLNRKSSTFEVYMRIGVLAG